MRTWRGSSSSRRCAVHETILDDRPLDEAHPLWPHSHYGAHKAAIEAFVHSYGRGHGYPICALRPTGIYGLARPARASKWFDLIAEGRPGRGRDLQARGQGGPCRRRRPGRGPAPLGRRDRGRGVLLLRPLHLRSRGRDDRQGAHREPERDPRRGPRRPGIRSSPTSCRPWACASAAGRCWSGRSARSSRRRGPRDAPAARASGQDVRDGAAPGDEREGALQAVAQLQVGGDAQAVVDRGDDVGRA